MKVQDLAIIFIIIILPISLVISTYTQYQIQTINTQTLYDSKLTAATYDAIRAFQINTTSSTTSDLANSKLRDLEASVSTFRNSIKSLFSLNGYSDDAMDRYIPALVYTLYDGFYIYSPYENVANTDGTIKNTSDNKDSQYGLKPYITYSCRYQTGNIDVVITYALDNHISVQGTIGNEYVNEQGYLIDNITYNEKNREVTYNGVEIESEHLTQHLPINGGEDEEYSYIKNNGITYYLDDKDEEESRIIARLNDTNLTVQSKKSKNPDEYKKWYNTITENTLAKEYYIEAYEFTEWFKSKGLQDLRYKDAKDSVIDENGNITENAQIWEDSNSKANQKIFEFNSSTTNYNNNIENQLSSFNEHRLAIIRHKIEVNLAIAISNYNTYSGTATNNVFQMPNLSEEEWYSITHNISLISFLQGLPIGGKTYNGNALVTNSESKEVVLEQNIYILGKDANSGKTQYYKIGDRGLTDGSVIVDSGKYAKSANSYISAGRINLDFNRAMIVTTDATKTYYFYPLKENNASYNSVIMQNDVDTYDDIYTYVNKQSLEVRTAFYTALGRERQSQYKSTNKQLANYKNVLVVGYAPEEHVNTFNAVTRNISNQLNQEDGIRASYEFSTDSNYLTNYILKNKERYDLIIIDSTYWGGPITQELINKIIKTTNVFTISNDAYMNDICISNKTMRDSRGKMSITTTGTEKFGGNYTTNLEFLDSNQLAIDFNENVQVLYEAVYNDSERHDAVGLWNNGECNWMYSQVANLHEDMKIFTKLVKYAMDNKTKTTITGSGEYGKIGQPMSSTITAVGVNANGNRADFGYADIDVYSVKVSNHTGTIIELDGNNNTGNGHSSTTNMWKNLAKTSNNGVLKGGTWGSNYLRLNGTDNWVNLGQINLSTQAEFDATIVANSIKDGEADIVGNFDLGGAGIWLSDGFPAFDIYSENRNEYISIKANKKITVGAKTRIVGRYDGRNLYLYVNGNLVARTDK